MVLLGFPLLLPMDATTRANDLAWYSAHTDPAGPAMTWSMYAVGYTELGAGFEEQAAQFFNRSFANNVQPPFAVWKEGGRGGGCPNFLTGAGGFLQTLLHAYPGLRVNSSAMTFHSPSLPQGATGVKLRGLAYLGNRLDVRITQTAVNVTLREDSAPALSPGAPKASLGVLDADAGTLIPLQVGVPLTISPPRTFSILRANKTK